MEVKQVIPFSFILSLFVALWVTGCLSNGTCCHVSSYKKKENVMPVTIYRTDQQISHCRPIERAYGSECTFLYWLSLMVLKVQSLTLSEWQIGMVLGLGRSQHMQAINSPPPTLQWVLWVYGENCGSSIANGWPAWTMAKLSPFLKHHQLYEAAALFGSSAFHKLNDFSFLWEIIVAV